MDNQRVDADLPSDVIEQNDNDNLIDELKEKLQNKEKELVDFKNKTKEYVLQLRHQLDEAKNKEENFKSQAKVVVTRLNEKHSNFVIERDERERILKEKTIAAIKSLKDQHQEEMHSITENLNQTIQETVKKSERNAALLREAIEQTGHAIPVHIGVELFAAELLCRLSEEEKENQGISIEDLQRVRSIFRGPAVQLDEIHNVVDGFRLLESEAASQFQELSSEASNIELSSKISESGSLTNGTSNISPEIAHTSIAQLEEILAQKKLETVKLSENLHKATIKISSNLIEAKNNMDAMKLKHSEEIAKIYANHETSLKNNITSKETQLEEEFVVSMKAAQEGLEASVKSTMKQEHDAVVGILTNRLEESATELERVRSQLQSLKEILRECEEEKTREVTKAKIELDSIKTIFAEKQLALEEQRALADEELRSMDEVTADAVASSSELKAKMETLKSELLAVKEDANDKKRKAKSYVESLIQKHKSDVAALIKSMEKSKIEATERLKSDHQVAYESNEEANYQRIDSLNAEIERQSRRIIELEEHTHQIVASTKRESEAIKMTELEMQTLIKLKMEETEKHKQLRKAAKQETVSLARRVEFQDSLLNKIEESLTNILVPRAQQILNSVRETESTIDAALATHDAHLVDTRTVVRAASSMDDISVPDEEEDEQDHYPTSIGKLEFLQHILSNELERVYRLNGKVKKICDMSIREEPPLTLLQSISQRIEDCLKPKPSTARRGSSAGRRLNVYDPIQS